MAPSAELLAQIRQVFRPDRLLRDPRANGEGVRIAVLDTGIDRNVLEAKFQARGLTILPVAGARFGPAGVEPYDGSQSAPHGTSVADIILTLAPRAQLFSADVFGPRGSCEVETVVRALYWAMDEWRCQIINLSLGIPESRLQPGQRRQQLLRGMEEAYYRDVLVVAAADNNHPLTRSYPAVFAPPLLSVNKRLFENPLEFAYRLENQVEFQAHARGYLGPFVDEPATSWAAPHLAGIAARLLSLWPGMKPFEMKTVLYWLSASPPA